MAGSSVIGDLRVNLGLDSTQLMQGLNAVGSRMSAFADNLNRRLGKLGDLPGVRALQGTLAGIGVNAGAAFGTMAATAVTALSAMSVSAINTAKEIQNLSRLANATPEEFQRWAYAGEQVGISQEKMSDILKDVNDRVGDFIATGGGPMADFFERIAPKVGITAEAFRGLSGPEALQLYVDSLEKANVNQQDFTFFMEAMASDSTALLPILRNGGKLAQEYGDRLEALGGVMDDETVTRLAGMKTALSEVGVVVAGVKNQLGAAFAPVVEALAQAFVSLMTEGSGLRLIFDGIASIAGWVADVFSDVVNIVGHIVSGIWSLISAGVAWINNLTGIGDAIVWVWDHSVGWLGDMIGWYSKMLNATGGLGGAYKLMGEVIAGVMSGIITSAAGVPIGLTAIWYRVKAGFTEMIVYLIGKWQEFLDLLNTTMAPLAFLVPGFQALGAAVSAGTEAAAGKVDDLKSSIAGFNAVADSGWMVAKSIVTQGFDESTAALGKLKLTVDETTEALGDGSGGLGAGLGAAGKAAGGGAAKLSKFQQVMKGLNEEAARLAATLRMTDLEAAIWGKQNEAGVSAASQQGQQIAAIMQQIDGMQKLKDATEKGRDAVKGFFESFLDGADAALQSLGNLLKEIAKVQFTKGIMGLIGGLGGGGLIEGIGRLLSYDGGGYTWDGPRTGGLDGRGGRLALLHPQETVLDHTRGQGFGEGQRIEVVPSEYFDVRVTRIADQSSARMGQQINQALPARVQQINANPRRR